MSQLLQCSCTSNGEIEDSGILGLLQMLPSRHDLTELQYERDGSTARLSPVKKARCVCRLFFFFFKGVGGAFTFGDYFESDLDDHFYIALFPAVKLTLI